MREITHRMIPSRPEPLPKDIRCRVCGHVQPETTVQRSHVVPLCPKCGRGRMAPVK